MHFHSQYKNVRYHCLSKKGGKINKTIEKVIFPLLFPGNIDKILKKITMSKRNL